MYKFLWVPKAARLRRANRPLHPACNFLLLDPCLLLNRAQCAQGCLLCSTDAGHAADVHTGVRSGGAQGVQTITAAQISQTEGAIPAAAEEQGCNWAKGQGDHCAFVESAPTLETSGQNQRLFLPLVQNLASAVLGSPAGITVLGLVVLVIGGLL